MGKKHKDKKKKNGKKQKKIEWRKSVAGTKDDPIMGSHSIEEVPDVFNSPEAHKESDDKINKELNRPNGSDPYQLVKPLPDIADLLGMFIWDQITNEGNPSSPKEITSWIVSFFGKSPLKLQIHLETEYEDFLKDYRSVASYVEQVQEGGRA